MEYMFRGYIPSSGKKPLYSVKTFELLKEPPKDHDYVGVLGEEYIQVDVDDAAFAEKVFEIVKEYKLRCNVLKTTRGLHFYFKNTNVKRQSVHCYSACGIPCDYGLGLANRVIPLRITQSIEKTKYVNGEEIKYFEKETTQREWLQTYGEVEELPAWLYPISLKDHGIMEIEFRNQSLFNYILVLQSKGLNREEIRSTIKIINKHILKNPLPDKEIDSITRDEAFSEELFFGEKGKFLHDVFGNYMLNNCHIALVNHQPHIYTDKLIYSSAVADFERKMIEKIPSLKETQRKEVYKYVTLKCDKEVEPASPKFLGLKSSILDLETMEEMPYSPNYVITNRVKYDYNENAYNETMDKTLNKVCCNDPEIRALLEEMIGYTLYRANTMQVCFILTGEGSNGKSTILDVIKRLLGKENYTTLELRELEETFKPAEMAGKLANLGDDISAKYLENSSVFKKCVTGNAFIVQKKYADPFEFECYATQIFCANELPPTSDKSDGFGRRIIIVPFRAKFSKADPDYDPFIEDKLMTEEAMEYLLKIAIDGLKRVLENKAFTKSVVSEAEKSIYLKSNNNVLEWFEEEPKIINECLGDVYLNYQMWCQRNGCSPVKQLNLSKEIKRMYGYVLKPQSIDGKTVRVYKEEIV